ncbi:MAG: PTS sugar transporter subunit IIA [Pseudomonadota bacterium]
MIGVVLVTHGSLGVSFKNAVEHVVGRQSHFETVCIEADDDMDRKRTEIADAISKVGETDGVVIVTDMFGGTPSNLAISFMEMGKIEVLAGANLPMLIKLATERETSSMKDVLEKAQQAGRKYIHVASDVLVK